MGGCKCRARTGRQRNLGPAQLGRLVQGWGGLAPSTAPLTSSHILLWHVALAASQSSAPPATSVPTSWVPRWRDSSCCTWKLGMPNTLRPSRRQGPGGDNKIWVRAEVSPVPGEGSSQLGDLLVF